jgi:glucose/arabinose dehydrogenase
MHRAIKFLVLIIVFLFGTHAFAFEPVESERLAFCVEEVAGDMRIPSSLAFISETQVLVGDREPGILRLIDVMSGEVVEIEGVPEMLRSGPVSSGLFDVKLARDFQSSRQLFLVYGIGTPEANGLAVSRFELSGKSLIKPKELFRSTTLIAGKWHFGGRLAVGSAHLYLSTGDGYDHKDLAQDPFHYAGKILRFNLDGGIPTDNPFADGKKGLPEVWAIGVRNPQGMAIDTRTETVYINEHGPQGGDEINIIRGGQNYGWPVITYGEEYGGGPIGDGITHAAGMVQPMFYWTPSIAPSGLMYYQSGRFPQWQGNLFSGALAKTHLNRLVIEEGRVIHEERLLADRTWRVRVVEQSPAGDIYFGIDGGQLMRLTPPDQDNQCQSDQGVEEAAATESDQ